MRIGSCVSGSAMGATHDPGQGNEQDGDDWLTPAVWCMACQDNIIVCGCGNGRIEVSTMVRL